MKESYFMKIYKKRWKLRLIPVAILLLVIIGMLSMAVFTYYDYTNNPTIVKTNEDYKRAVENGSYIQVSVDKLYDLGLVMTETRSKFGIEVDKSTKSNFVAIKLDKKILPIAIPTDLYKEIMNENKKTYVLKGKLIKFKNNELEVFKNSIVKSGGSAKAVDSLAYTYYLDYTTPFDAALMYVLGAGLIILYITILFIPVVRKNREALKKLKNYSQGNLETACQKIDEEIKLSDVYKNGPIIITKSYIIVESQQIVFAMPIKELMWVFKQSVKFKMFNIIPIGKKSDSIVFVFSDKSVYKLDIYKGEEKIDSTIKYISDKYSSCFVGFSEELAHLFKNSYDEFTYKWKNNNKSISTEADTIS